MAGVAWSTLHGFVGSEHRPALVHLSSPLSTIHPGDNAQAATALTANLMQWAARALTRMNCLGG
jgi:hypothetical protein